MLNSSFVYLLTRLAIRSLLFSLWVRANSLSLLVCWDFSVLSSSDFSFSFLLDTYSLAFLFTVLIITRAVLLFSRSYIEQEKHFLRFHLLVIAFVISIIFLILRPNLISLLLGWDGLGVTSYLLVIYFNRRKSFNAGLLTALSNRVGDVLILLAIALLIIIGSWETTLFAKGELSSLQSSFLACLLLLAGRTKSAQIPFSAWLPAAIAAPTPVSSLVHSSTLVTAGVYLLYRFNSIFSVQNSWTLLIFIGTLTILMAGIRALYELDIKKIVALSTLSQLGLIISALSFGLHEAAFFHLLAHAFFKALLFITIGQGIHLSADFQDLRKVRLARAIAPISLAFSLVANLSLCGFPFTAGFYSKDFYFEQLFLENLWGGLIFLNSLAIILTSVYTLRLIFWILLNPLNIRTLHNGQDNNIFINLSISTLWPLAITGGSFLLWGLFPSPPRIFLPYEIKNTLLTLFSFTLFFSWQVLTQKKSRGSFLDNWRWGQIWALPFFSASFLSPPFLKLRRLARKLDLSWIPQTYLVFYSINASSFLSTEKFFLNKIAYSLFTALWLILILILIYLCILNIN